jgi:2,3-bisphosphoglycerate-independent phosphoglycerate mutase
MAELFKLKAAAIAVYPMYRGLAQLVGMEVLETGRSIADQAATLKKHYAEFDFFFVHVKKTDSYGEDGDFAHKVGVIEEFDRWLPEILELTPDVLVVSGDHSTPALMKGHSWHPNPVLLKAAFQRRTAVPGAALDAIACGPPQGQGCGKITARQSGVKFGETACAQGVLGRFSAMEVLPLMMANAMKFKKFGA